MSADPNQRDRVRDDLDGLVRGEVLFDELNRTLYATDASIFQVEPLGVVAPLDEADAQAVVRYAAENHIPVVPRGAGTGVAGESLGSGIVLDLSRHFRDIIETTADTVRVQPGVVLQQLNDHLAKFGRRFAPDPASATSCTIGGMIATDASGSRAVRFGYTRDHVVRVRAVLDNGEAVELGPTPLPFASDPPRLREIVTATAQLLDLNADLIRTGRPKTPFDRCGYRLADVLGPGTLDLARLLVGSEGTLALVTEATLKTVSVPGGRSVVLLCFDSLELALRAVPLILPTRPTVCDMLDRRLLSLSPTAGTRTLVPPGTEAALLVEYETDRPAAAKAAAVSLADRLHHTDRLTLRATAAYEPAEVARIWSVREFALPGLYGLDRGPRPLAFVEDVGVPPDELPVFLPKVRDLLQRHEVTASLMVHAATGQMHIRPFLDPHAPADAAKMWPLAEAVHALALAVGGTVSSQHGTGLARTPWVERQFGPLAEVFRELKAIFDPAGLFNPGKIVAGSNPLVWPLRTRPESPKVPLQLLWPEGEVERQTAACNGCGQCRVRVGPARMCPLFRVTSDEAAAPRAKANLLRYLLTSTDPKRWSDDDVRAVADLCVNCKMCARECPAHVNVPKLMLEAKAAHHAEHGLDRADWVMARAEGLAALGSRFAEAINPVLASRSARWMMERLFGISRRRRLPPFAKHSFLALARRRGWTRPPQARGSQPPGSDRVAYFVDVFANTNDPQVAAATVAVLNHNGIEVHVPPGQRGSGMAPLAMGDVETARERAVLNVRVLAEVARAGWRIVCSEPTAALMLRHDYLDLLDDADARAVADQTVELTTYLGELHRAGRLRTDFLPLDIAVGHHLPCHLKALTPDPAGPRLLGLIPKVRVRTIDVSCSGMAGTYGLKRRNYWASLEAGRPMIEELSKPGVLFGAAECSSCRMQMEEGSGKRALHPVQYLALAYGLMPEIGRRLRTPLSDKMFP